MSEKWEAILAVEGKPTVDGRFFPVDSLSWRDLPLSLLAQTKTAEGHDGAEVCGRIDEIWREAQDDGTTLIMGRGVFDSGDHGTEIGRMVKDGVLTGLSVDVANTGVELRDAESGDTIEMADADPFEVMMGGKYQTVLLDGKIGAATIVPFPAFDDASVAVVAAGDYEIRVSSKLEMEFVVALTAAAEGMAPLHPPTSWFGDPGLRGPTPLTVTDDGRVFGHLATWGTCHIGRPGACTTPPRSNADYSYFHLGELETDEGETISVGKITLDTGHAPLSATRGATVRHYDDTGTVAADVRAGEDDFGIWVAGAVRPTVEPNQVRKLRAASISGDWRRIDGNLELVAALAVNVPGFPIPRAQAEVASGAEGERTLALVASAIVERIPMGVDEARTRIDAIVDLTDVFAGDYCRRCGKQGCTQHDA